MKDTETLERLCKIVEKQLEKAVDELDQRNGKLPQADAEYLDYLTHTIKSIKTTLAMEGYGSSERRGRDSMGRYTSRDDGRSEWGYYPRAWDDGRSYEREGRSMHGEDREKLERLMNETSDPSVKRALREALHNY